MIENKEQAQLTRSLIEEIDKTINNCYVLLKGLSQEFNFKEVTELEDLIQKLKYKRLGHWGLLTVYVSELEKNISPNKEIYVVQEDVSLVDISNAYFGVPDYAHHIYIENDLETSILEVGQNITIPIIEEVELIAKHSDVIEGDLYNVIIENLGLRLYE